MDNFNIISLIKRHSSINIIDKFKGWVTKKEETDKKKIINIKVLLKIKLKPGGLNFRLEVKILIALIILKINLISGNYM